MKNLGIAFAILIVIMIFVFFFAKGDQKSNDTVIPEPINVISPSPVLSETSLSENQNRQDHMQVPFQILKKEEVDRKKVIMSTKKGTIIIELAGEAPIASSNFIHLINKKFYDGLTFHRREENFVIQGGDPNGDGTGGPGYSFVDEPVAGNYVRGTVAMANAGPNTNGSQFFITLSDALNLPKQYTIFGKVVKGMDVVDNIQVGDKIEKVILQQSL